jgi:hypothetical protein
MRIGRHVKYPSFLSDFNETNFLTYFRKILKYQIEWKSFQWEPSCSTGTDGHTVITKLIVAFLNFVIARNKNLVYTDIKFHKKKKYVMKIILQVWKSHTLYRKNISGLIAVLNHVETVKFTNLSDQITVSTGIKLREK